MDDNNESNDFVNAPFEDDLIQAAQSSLDFWDNPFDDEDWNNA